MHRCLCVCAAGSSDEGEPAGGSGGAESAEMEENSSLRSSSSSASSAGRPPYRESKSEAGSDEQLFPGYPRKRSAHERELAYQRLEQLQYEARPQHSDDERKPWDFADKHYQHRNYKRVCREDYREYPAVAPSDARMGLAGFGGSKGRPMEVAGSNGF